MRLAAVVAALAICVPRTSGAVEYAFEANKLIGRAVRRQRGRWSLWCVARPDWPLAARGAARAQKVLERDENYERAIEVIEQAREILEQWKDSMMEDEEEGAEGGEGGEGGKAGGPGTAAEDSPVEFVWETTSQPERACRERAEAGDVLRLHYITKLHSTKQVVDSSFHTGSTPLKITLGRPELPGAWNRALEVRAGRRARGQSLRSRLGRPHNRRPSRCVRPRACAWASAAASSPLPSWPTARSGTARCPRAATLSSSSSSWT